MKLSEREYKQTWIVGVSGGSDSMALLHMCVSAHMKIIVAHMNYQKRASAKRDMMGVKAYCEAHQIPLEIRYQNEPCHENFQAFARKKRYAFYRESAIRYDAAGVLVAHQLDDHLETYLMQKKRNSIPQVYGLSDHVMIHDCLVVRPLLSYTKAQLEAYCIEHDVPFWLDESNTSDIYTRNRIRHAYIDAMSHKEKQALSAEISAHNEALTQERQNALAFLQTWEFDCLSLLQLPVNRQFHVLYAWIEQTSKQSVSYKEIQSLLTMIKQNGNHTRICAGNFEMRKEYDTLSLTQHQTNTTSQAHDYSYTWETPDQITDVQTPYFTLSKHGETIEGVTLSQDDFPITIRNARAGDRITLRYGEKKVSRFLIDRKIPKAMRKTWPVMVNRKGNIIFVSKIGCDISHFTNNPSIFVLK